MTSYSACRTVDPRATIFQSGLDWPRIRTKVRYREASEDACARNAKLDAGGVVCSHTGRKAILYINRTNQMVRELPSLTSRPLLKQERLNHRPIDATDHDTNNK